ncbi:MAG TPA: hypothetical protein VGR62_16235 [Candidatus Binatia bacterium]|nr:hypothetical protein [Candidatus Binatia bacterium]
MYAIVHRGWLGYALLTFVALSTSAAFARATPAEKCAASKYRLIGKTLRGRIACEVPAASGKHPADPECPARVQAAFVDGWARAEAAGACLPRTLVPVEVALDAIPREMLDRLRPSSAPSRCTAGKLDRAARYGMARLACSARASLKGWPPTHKAVVRCLAAGRARFMAAFRRLESRRDCQTTGDATAVAETLEQFVVCIDAALSGIDGGACGATTTTTTTTSSFTTVTVDGSSTTIPVTTTIGGGGTSTTTTVSTTTTSTSIPSSSTTITTTTSITTTTAGSTSTSTTSTTTMSTTTTSTTTSGGTSTSTTFLPCGGLFPVCLGDCPAGQTCTASTLGAACGCVVASTTTTTTLLPCGGLYPLCLGSCPDGEECTAGALAEPCGCVTTTVPTSTTTTTLLSCGGLYPICLGSCPTGQQCTGAGLADPCACVPVTTTTTVPTPPTTSTTLLACGGLFPVCLGSCPDGEACTGAGLAAPCGCAPITTSTTAPTATTTTTSTTTSSTLLACGGLFPVCLGSCPDGEECTGAGLAAPCGCAPITTTTLTSTTTSTTAVPTTSTTSTTSTTTSSTLLACGGLFPVCLGSCPDGEECTGAGLAAPCGCAPITTTTSTSTTTSTTAVPTTTTTSTTSSTTSSTLLACGGLYPVCLGSCPPGEECTGAGLAAPCACAPITTTTTTSSTSSTSSTSTTSTSAPTTTTTSTTLLPCGGVAPVCVGSCPPGLTCMGPFLSACTCQ